MINLKELWKREDFLFKNVPECPKCNANQIQLVFKSKPPFWKCRECKHEFWKEPEEVK